MEGPHLLAKNVQKTVNISSKTLKCLVRKTADFSAQFFTCEEDRHRVRQDCNLISLSFFFSQYLFFWLNILLGFLGFIFKVHKLSSKFDFFFFIFRCCSIMYPWLDFTIFFSHACVYFRLYCSRHRQCSHIHFDTLFYYVEKLFFSFGNSTYF